MHANKSALSIPATLIVRWDLIRRVRDQAHDRWLQRSPRHRAETPPTSQNRAATEAFLTERLNNLTWAYSGFEPRTPDLQRFSLATRPPRQL
ncbi:unnamed protein product, partial [Brenthis ino]